MQPFFVFTHLKSIQKQPCMEEAQAITLKIIFRWSALARPCRPSTWEWTWPLSIRRVQTPVWENSTTFPSTTWTSANPAVGRAYYSGWPPSARFSSNIIHILLLQEVLQSVMGHSGRSNAAQLEESDLPKKSSHQDFIQHVQFYSVQFHTQCRPNVTSLVKHLFSAV